MQQVQVGSTTLLGGMCTDCKTPTNSMRSAHRGPQKPARLLGSQHNKRVICGTRCHCSH